jgi:hypothetical protein
MASTRVSSEVDFVDNFGVMADSPFSGVRGQGSGISRGLLLHLLPLCGDGA